MLHSLKAITLVQPWHDLGVGNARLLAEMTPAFQPGYDERRENQSGNLATQKVVIPTVKNQPHHHS